MFCPWLEAPQGEPGLGVNAEGAAARGWQLTVLGGLSKVGYDWSTALC